MSPWRARTPPSCWVGLGQQWDLLEELLRPLSPADWDLLTPAEGWRIRPSAAHLTWAKRTALTATKDPKAFVQLRERFTTEADVDNRAAAENAT